jgi:hypothetical protein
VTREELQIFKYLEKRVDPKSAIVQYCAGAGRDCLHGRSFLTLEKVVHLDSSTRSTVLPESRLQSTNPQPGGFGA